MSQPSRFTGDAAQNYEKYLGPLLFTPFAKHVANTTYNVSEFSILEIAAGTGQLTSQLAEKYDDRVHFVATDLSEDMLLITTNKVKGKNIDVRYADVHNLPFEDGSFDKIYCQFGLMFFKDKMLALSEVKRVLKTEGLFIFSTWDKIENSPMLDLVYNKILFPYFEENDITKFSVPFSMNDTNAMLQLILSAGFETCEIKNLLLPAGVNDLNHIMEAFFLKNEMINHLFEQEEDAIPFITTELETRIPEAAKKNPSFFNLSGFIGIATK